MAMVLHLREMTDRIEGKVTQPIEADVTMNLAEAIAEAGSGLRRAGTSTAEFAKNSPKEQQETATAGARESMKTKTATLPKVEVQRPTEFDSAIVDRICDRLAAGENLRKFCVWPDWPTKRTVKLWAREQPTFGVKMRKILQARQTAAAKSERKKNPSGSTRTSMRDHARAREGTQ